ncbi:MAG: alpha/beta hydrolase [Saonia sp.]
MKKIRLALCATAVFLGLALSLQAHVYGTFLLKPLEILWSDGIDNLGFQYPRMSKKQDSPSYDGEKKHIALGTGITMKYIERGTPNGKTLLFLHGYTDTSRSFERVIQELMEFNGGLHILVPDLRGHGESSMPHYSETANGFEISNFTADILDFINQLNLKEVVLVGHSMGSIIAQEIALMHPEKISSLILMGTFANTKENPMVQDFLLKDLIKAEWGRILHTKFGEDWRNTSYLLTPKYLGDDVVTFLKENWVVEAYAPETFLETVYLETIATPFGTWFGALESIAAVDNTTKLRNLAVPTLVLWGNDDTIFPESPDQSELKLILEECSQKNAVPMYFKTYISPLETHSEIGHNFHWGIPHIVAMDIGSFVKIGKPIVHTLTDLKNRKGTISQPYSKVQFWGVGD